MVDKIKVNYKQYLKKPILVFLDTNIIIEMVDGVASGKKEHRGQKLFKELKKYVDSGKILCPFVYQRNEYLQYFNEDKKKKCDDILISLSKGQQVTIVPESIFEKQFKRMLLNYLRLDSAKKAISFNFYIEDIFDPRFNSISPLEKTLGIRLAVLISGFLYPNERESEKNMLVLFKKRREQIRRDKMTKEQVLEEEKRGRFYDLFKNDDDRRKFYLEKINPKASFIEEQSLMETKGRIIKYWEEVLKEQKLTRDVAKLGLFLKGECFLGIPMDYISSALYTELLCNNNEIKITDSRDITSLSIILPYSSIAIVDKVMSSYIYISKLNKIFNVDVYSLRSLKKFLMKLKEIIGE